MRPVAQTGRSGDITGVMPARDDAGLEATQIAGAGDTLTASGDGPTSRAEPIGRGASFGRYTVLSRLGAGGMGVVFAAYDPELDRKVALKLLHPQVGAAAASTMGRARLVREAQAMARLSHPNVVAIYDVGTLDDRVWLAMEYVDGRTLGAWLKEQPRRWPEVLQVMLAVGRGLVAAHAAGLVHRDLKPDNIMVDREGRARVMDFGLARSAESRASDAPDRRADRRDHPQRPERQGHPVRRRHRHADVHGPGAVARRGGGRARRPVRVLRDPVGEPPRRASLRR
jgi:serine/threonine protein kinase